MGGREFPVHVTMGPRLPFQNCDDADYVRRLTLAYASKILHKYQVKGDCAELGVFRGDFARLINEAFPESTLYLFDTFEGFDDRDVAADGQFNLSVESSTALYEKLKDTSVQTVLDKMPFPEKCVVRKGYFPDTAEGMPEDARFAFVSIDADLYTPILKGLEYFYPRMERLGMILVHDYGVAGIGAGQAVDEFCKSNGIIPIPVADEYRSAMIVRF